MHRESCNVILYGGSDGADNGNVHECSIDEGNLNWQSEEINCHCVAQRLAKNNGHWKRICIIWWIFCTFLVHDRTRSILCNAGKGQGRWI